MCFKVNIFVNYWQFLVQFNCFPGLVRVPHIKPVYVEIIIVKASDLEYKATVNHCESGVKLANGQIGQSTPSKPSNVKAVTLWLSNGNHSHLHVVT